MYTEPKFVINFVYVFCIIYAFDYFRYLLLSLLILKTSEVYFEYFLIVSQELKIRIQTNVHNKITNLNYINKTNTFENATTVTNIVKKFPTAPILDK